VAEPASADRAIGAEPTKPAFYALRTGGWRDYWTLLHPPYTAWHLSYVVIGASVAPAFNGPRLGASVLGFFLGVGICAHALDELRGRPLRTRIPAPVLWTFASVALAGAVALGVLGAIRVSWWLLAFVAFGAFIVVAYNLELFRGVFHGDVWFALAWGAFPALTGSFAQDGRLDAAALLVAAACFALSATQRILSTPVRHLRRNVASVRGEMVRTDGTVEPVDEAALRRAPEAALRALTGAVCLLALGLVAARLIAA
jgi:hypothetical protein